MKVAIGPSVTEVAIEFTILSMIHPLERDKKFWQWKICLCLCCYVFDSFDQL